MIGWLRRWIERRRHDKLLRQEVERRARVLQGQLEVALEVRRLRREREEGGHRA